MMMEEERVHQCKHLSSTTSLFSSSEYRQEPTRALFDQEAERNTSVIPSAVENDNYLTRGENLDPLRTRAGWRRSLELQSNGGGRSSDLAGLPADRYFDALEGPELDILKVQNFHI